MNKLLLNDRDCTAQAIKTRIQKAFLRKQRYLDLGKAVFLVVFICIMFQFVFGFSVMYGNSMDPALADGDLVLYYRLPSTYETGDPVVYEEEGITYVGRIAALPGEEVEITEDGQLVINGYTQAEFTGEDAYASGSITYPLELEENEYFIMVDEHTSTEDSRTFGAVSERDIKGTVITLLRRREI